MKDHLDLPHDLPSEKAVLASVLKRPTVMAALEYVQPSDFYAVRHQAIWRAMLDLWNRNAPIDIVTLASRLRAPDLAEAGVDLPELADLALVMATGSHAEHYASVVMNAATQRRYIGAAQATAEQAYIEGVDIAELVGQSEARLTAAQPRNSRRDLYDPQSWAAAFWDDLEARSSGQRTSVSTGLIDLDAMTLGLEAGGLYLLMGTPGTGKTELVMQVAIHVARTHGTVLFASLEMSAVELAHRYARITRGLNRNHMAAGKLDDDELPTVNQVVNDMQKLPLWPASPTGQYTTLDLRADAMEVRSKAGHIALIVADYVQRFRDRGGKTSTREENVGLVAENLKSLAREFGCPVLAPVQPNRDYVGRSNKRPLLSDLRESGKLEQEADVVLGLYRDEKHDDKTNDRGTAEVHVLKNRSGVGDADGMRKIAWRSSRYDNFTTKQQAAQAAAYWAA